MEIRARITDEPQFDGDCQPWTARVFVGGELELTAILYDDTRDRVVARAEDLATALRNAEDSEDGEWIAL